MRDKIKAVVQTKKNSDYVWTCDFCGEEFKTKKESDKHELKCKKNPVNKNKKNRNIYFNFSHFLFCLSVHIFYS